MKAPEKHSTADWHSFIAPIANRLMDFSKRNPLLNLDQPSLIFPLGQEILEDQVKIKIELGQKISNLLKKKNLIQKETGLNTLYLSWGIYKIQNEGLNRLPFYLIPIEIKSNKDKNTIEIIPDWESKVINPVLEKILEEKYNLEAKAEAVSGWEATIGIFNYKKYILLSEIYKMSSENLSNPIRQLFDFDPEESIGNELKFDLDSLLISDADPSQRRIISRSIKSDSFCVQGPPGTGKSQTISNIISANLSQGKRILFVSEKKAAIDVVHEKLKSSGLGSVATQITDSSSDKKNFIQSLSKQWEENKNKEEQELRPKEYGAAYSKVQLYLDHLFRHHPDLGMNLNDALKTAASFEKKSKLQKAPKLDRWTQSKPLIDFLYAEIQKEYLSSEDLPWLLMLNPNMFSASDLKNKLDLHLKILSDNLSKIQSKKIDLKELQKHSIQARVICGLQFKEKIDILKDEVKLKKYRLETKKYFRLQKEMKNLAIELKSWRKIPSKENLEFWQINLKEKGWFNSKRKKAEKSLNQFLNGPVENPEKLFQITKKYFETEIKWNSCLSNLKVSFQISDPEREIDELNLILSKMDHQKSLFDLLLNKPIEDLEYLDELNPILDKIQHSKRFLFGIALDSINDLQNGTDILQKLIDFIICNQNLFKENIHLEDEEIKFYCQFSDSETIEKEIFQSNISKVVNQSSILKEIERKELNLLINEIIQKRQNNLKVNPKALVHQLKKDFLELEELLITPAGRLKQEEKNLKKEVRIGKRILTHEFAKTRSFKTIRELCEIESKEWVFRMKKVWMMNPMSISEILPFEKEQFDLLIIDEASQIPEEDIIPALYRAKQVIIVGDKMQMPPSNFFSGNEVGPSILDTAHFRLPEQMLQWHYRSKTPELIAFSNHAFYDSQLIVNPSFHHKDSALNFHYVDDSNYKEGTNSKEAKALLNHLKSNLSALTGSIGIGCFSLAQQRSIEKLIAKETVLSDLIEKEKLFVRNLENLQGDECDHLLISIGYGPNPEGKLMMNFGPLSKNGGHNRLNVLITRARITVDVFASFQPEELQLSDNEGINYLKEYLEFVKEHKTDFNWPDLHIDAENKKVEYKITDPTDLETILSRVNVLKSNGFAALVSTKLS